MKEQRFRFSECSQERLWAARWHLFEFAAVGNVVQLCADIVAVLYDGEPRTQEWVALLEERGLRLEPIAGSTRLKWLSNTSTAPKQK